MFNPCLFWLSRRLPLVKLVGMASKPKNSVFPSPFEDPDGALALLNEQWECDPTSAASVESILMDYLRDIAEISTVVLDIETTELISSVPISSMKTSIATVMLLEQHSLGLPAETLLQRSTQLQFWAHESGRGAPLRLLAHVLDHAKLIVAYNGLAFDLVVLSGGDESRWRYKVHDPFLILFKETGRRFKLASILSANGITPKSGSGADAPLLWRAGQLGDDTAWDALSSYNANDVLILTELVLRPSIRVPGGRLIPSASIRPLPLNFRFYCKKQTRVTFST